MEDSNLPGLSPLWLISLALALGTTIVVLLPVTIASGDAIKSSDWIGFAGNVAAGSMTLVAAGVAWITVQRQIEEQRKIANRQMAIQSFDVLIRQSELLEDETILVHGTITATGHFYATCGFLGFNDGKMAFETVVQLRDKIDGFRNALIELRDKLLESRTRRWIAPQIFPQRADMAQALTRLAAILPKYQDILDNAAVTRLAAGSLTEDQIAIIRFHSPMTELNDLLKAAKEYGDSIDALRHRVHAQTARAREEIGI